MRVAVACDGQDVSPHFGRCEQFLLADVVDGKVQVLEWMPTPDHEPGLLPRLMSERQVECIIAGGCGPRAMGMFQQAGIGFVPGVTGSAAEALVAFANGTLEAGESACHH